MEVQTSDQLWSDLEEALHKQRPRNLSDWSNAAKKSEVKLLHSQTGNQFMLLNSAGSLRVSSPDLTGFSLDKLLIN